MQAKQKYDANSVPPPAKIHVSHDHSRHSDYSKSKIAHLEKLVAGEVEWLNEPEAEAAPVAESKPAKSKLLGSKK